MILIYLLIINESRFEYAIVAFGLRETVIAFRVARVTLADSIVANSVQIAVVDTIGFSVSFFEFLDVRAS